MSVDLIRYDLLVQDALRAVVRRVLTDVARDGLPGDHHLYVSFDTRAPGVRLSNRLKERYPEEMTIVLQHQFWDLVVTELFFEVGLSFNGIPERLHVPFDALKGFFDPSVKFGLQFEPPSAEEAEPETDAPGVAGNGTGGAEVASLADARPAAREPSKAPTSVPTAPAARPQPAAAAGEPAPKSAAPKPATTKPAKDEPAAMVSKSDAKSEAAKSEAAKPEAAKSAAGAKADKAKPEESKSGETKSDEAKEGGAQVVRLDAFRKK
ncbi:ClpXP protease specificity-enhancing factor SspB [Ancylobacter sp. Lp-2]|uniref:ClpXP protease specificity-enhancing factor SspB n=1 Tax=Ancylobacter sp. Lp-2 TaxID=2881339 RepID=UPI001E4B0948|nr:ClpXP protease specificity-enhancing factor SspB [Ancylobacter sp. Lp-2]MCB4770908.1 ClpXP protease specificity-enhancing factor SspB [Ancylobacter sp. Lp-2]